MPTLLANIRPWGRELASLLIDDGTVTEVLPADNAAAGSVAAAGGDVIDGEGMLALPAFSDLHVHLDSSRIGLPFRPHTARGKTLWDYIANDRENWRSAEASVSDRATFTLGSAIKNGMTRARSFAQVDADSGLERLEGVLAAKEAHAGRADVEIVAFPQAGLLLEPGVEELMEAALDSGAQVVGGLDPCALDRDPKRHLDSIFAMAEKRGAKLDIHLHEPGELGLFTAREIIARVRSLDYTHRVTISHAFFLGDIAQPVLDALLEEFAELGISVTTVAPGGRTLPFLTLRDKGVRLGLGQDGQRDYWSPYGNTDMLDRTWQLAFTNSLRRDDLIEQAIETATLGGASLLDDRPWGAGRGFDAGDPADFVLMHAQTAVSAVMDRPRERTVLRAGRVIAQNGEFC